MIDSSRKVFFNITTPPGKEWRALPNTGLTTLTDAIFVPSANSFVVVGQRGSNAAYATTDRPNQAWSEESRLHTAASGFTYIYDAVANEPSTNNVLIIGRPISNGTYYVGRNSYPYVYNGVFFTTTTPIVSSTTATSNNLYTIRSGTSSRGGTFSSIKFINGNYKISTTGGNFMQTKSANLNSIANTSNIFDPVAANNFNFSVLRPRSVAAANNSLFVAVGEIGANIGGFFATGNNYTNITRCEPLGSGTSNLNLPMEAVFWTGSSFLAAGYKGNIFRTTNPTSGSWDFPVNQVTNFTRNFTYNPVFTKIGSTILCGPFEINETGNIGFGYYASTNDGASWSLRKVLNYFPSSNYMDFQPGAYQSMAASGSRFVIVGGAYPNYGNAGARLYYSSTGNNLDWTAVDVSSLIPAGRSLGGVVWSGNYFYAWTQSDDEIIRSSDGVSWSSYKIFPANNPDDIKFAIANANTVVFSGRVSGSPTATIYSETSNTYSILSTNLGDESTGLLNNGMVVDNRFTLFSSNSNFIVTSSNTNYSNTSTWTVVNNNRGGFTDYEANSTVQFLGFDRFGLLRSTDDNNWNYSSNLSGRFISSYNSNTVITFYNTRYISTDQGNTAANSSTLAFGSGYANELYSFANNGVIFAVGFESPYIKYSLNGGLTWNDATGVNTSIRTVVLRPYDNKFFAFGTNGTVFENVLYPINSSGNSVYYQATGGIAGFVSGGFNNGPVATFGDKNTIEKFLFSSDGITTDVGDLTSGRYMAAGQSSTTSGYSSGGRAANNVYNVIEKFSLTSGGNATDVGDLTIGRIRLAGQSSTTHGYSTGGQQIPSPPGTTGTNVIDKFPFATDTNATDVGDLFEASALAGHSSTTHGYSSGGSGINDFAIAKFPFASDSNATYVGSLTVERNALAGVSSNAHGYSLGGYQPGFPLTNIIDKFPFASDSNATDVGNLTSGRSVAAGVSSYYFGYVAGGMNGSTEVNIIEKFPFATDTNSTDVGDLTIGKRDMAGHQL